MSDLISSDDPFTEAHKQALREIVGYMIPAGAGRPAASDEIIFAEILSALRAEPEAVDEIVDIYRSTDLQLLSRLRNPVLSTLVSYTVQCYYRDDRVMQALDMEPRAPHPQGYEIAQGDFGLLDPVRARGQIYREA
jgi:hypothetical protein